MDIYIYISLSCITLPFLKYIIQFKKKKKKKINVGLQQYQQNISPNVGSHSQYKPDKT